jgi:hypothetical protein
MKQLFFALIVFSGCRAQSPNNITLTTSDCVQKSYWHGTYSAGPSTTIVCMDFEQIALSNGCHVVDTPQGEPPQMQDSTGAIYILAFKRQTERTPDEKAAISELIGVCRDPITSTERAFFYWKPLSK